MPPQTVCQARLEPRKDVMCGRIRSYADAAVGTRGPKVRLTVSPQNAIQS